MEKRWIKIVFIHRFRLSKSKKAYFLTASIALSARNPAPLRNFRNQLCIGNLSILTDNNYRTSQQTAQRTVSAIRTP